MKKRLGAGAALLPIMIWCGVAIADDQTAPPGPSPSAPGVGGLACVNGGNQYRVGEFACIAACHGERRLARCDAGTDHATWTFVSNACPSAMINPPWPAAWSELPVATAMSPKPLVLNRSFPPPEVRLAFASFSR